MRKRDVVISHYYLEEKCSGVSLCHDKGEQRRDMVVIRKVRVQKKEMFEESWRTTNGLEFLLDLVLLLLCTSNHGYW